MGVRRRWSQSSKQEVVGAYMKVLVVWTERNDQMLECDARRSVRMWTVPGHVGQWKGRSWMTSPSPHRLWTSETGRLTAIVTVTQKMQAGTGQKGRSSALAPLHL